MKREKGDWRLKLDSVCLAALEVHRKRRAILSAFPSSPAGRAQARKALRDYPLPMGIQKYKLVRLQKDFVRLLRSEKEYRGLFRVGDNELPALEADMFEGAQRLARVLEKSPRMRLAFYEFLAFCAIMLKEVFTEFRKQQFGHRPLDPEHFQGLVASFLRILAGAFEGEFVLPKRGYNLEKIALIAFIREHQKQKLTFPELCKALEYAGVYVGDAENLRIAVWRAKSKGFLGGDSRDHSSKAG